MNKDGKMDIVSVSKKDGKINVHYNNGKGEFNDRISFPGYQYNRAVCLFDANKDGYLDVAAVTDVSGKLYVLLNDGTGKLKAARSFPAGTMAHDVTPGDINGDGKLDLVVAVVSSNVVKVFLGDGTGSFSTPKAIRTGEGPRSVKIGDMNGDGTEDIVVGCGDNRIHVHFNGGGMMFKEKVAFRSGGDNWALGVADLNGDGKLDIAAGSYIDREMCVHFNVGGKSFEATQCVRSGAHNFDLVIGDFDLDGDQDIVTCSTVDNFIGVHLNEKGVFTNRYKIPSGNWNSGIAAGDFDGDGDLDVVTSSINDNMINIHRNISIDEHEGEVGTRCVSGVVYNKETKEIMPNTPITLLDANGNTWKTTTSDEAGKYSFCFKEGKSSKLTFKVRAYGFPVYTEDFMMPNSNLDKDIYVGRPTGAFVYGRVTDQATRRPLPGSKIEISDNSGNLLATLKADAKGMYKKRLPLGNDYFIKANKQDYMEASFYFSITEGDAQDGRRVDLELGSDEALAMIEKKVELPKKTCVWGVVKDEATGELLPEAVIVVTNSAGVEINRYKVKDGARFKICLPFDTYSFHTTKEGYFFDVTEIEFSPEDAEEGKREDITLKKLEVGAKIVLENIYYDYDKATLRDESIEELNRLIQIMNDNPSLIVEISGHTDGDGSDSYNLRLSDARAQSVVDYLIGSEIYESRMEAKGYGEREPIAPNDTPENKQLNRRTEFKVIAF